MQYTSISITVYKKMAHLSRLNKPRLAASPAYSAWHVVRSSVQSFSFNLVHFIEQMYVKHRGLDVFNFDHQHDKFRTMHLRAVCNAA